MILQKISARLNFLKEFPQRESYHVNTVVFLRFFASFCVVWTHLCIAVPNFISKGSFLRATPNLALYGVEIFFIISGFIIPWSLYHTRYNIRKFDFFMLKRLIRLDPPYLATIVIILILNYYYSLHHGTEYTVNYKALLFHLGYLNAFLGYPWLNSVFWTLAIEFQYYILIGVMYGMIVSKNAHFRYLAILLFAFPLISGRLGLAISNPHTITAYSHLFLLGIITFLIRKSLITWQEFIIILVFLIAMGILNSSTILYRTIFWIASVTTILFFNFGTKITDFLGKVSYSLYLTHELFGARTINLFSGIANNAFSKFLVLFLALAVCVVCAYIFYLFIEIPSMQLSKKIKY